MRRGAGRETKREAGLERLPSPLPPPSIPGSGLPHPPQGALLLTAEESEEQTSAWAVIKLLSHLLQQVSPREGQINKASNVATLCDSDVLTQREQ